MNRTKRLFAILMAAIFALSLVPAGAFAADSGTMHDGTAAGQGRITIANTTSSETYDIYRIFDLASFSDSNTSPGQHGNEQYSYVIREKIGDSNTVNPWYTFLTMQTLGTNAVKIAKVASSEGTAEVGQLFWIEPARITLVDPYGTERSDYHVVTATSNFPSDWDVSGTAIQGSTSTYKYDEQNYSQPATGKESVKIVQQFAQKALEYARETEGSAARISPNYSEQGNGDIDTPGSVVVNTTDSLDTGLDRGKPVSGKVYLGWYLMGTSTGTLASLDTTNTDVTIYEKSLKPDIKKRVLNKRAMLNDSGARSTLSFTREQLEDVESNSSIWVKDTNADLGDYLLFKTVIYAQHAVGSLVLHDVMEEGLEFVDSSNATDSSSSYLDGSNAGTGILYNVSKDSNDQYDYSLKVFHIDYTRNADSTVVFASASEVPRTGKLNDSDTRINFTVEKSANDKCDFEVRFNNSGGAYEYQDAAGTTHVVDEDDELVVLYWAKVTSLAELWGHETQATNDKSTIKSSDTTLDDAHQVVHTTRDANGRNDNYTILTYGSGSHTKMDKASVTTYQFDVAKTTAGDGNGNYPLLAGAQFEVYKANSYSGVTKDTPISGGKTFALQGTGGGSTAYSATSEALLFNRVEADDHNKAYYRFAGDAASSSTDTTSVIESSDNIEISLRGLEAGTYLLYETKAPTGYNKLAYPIVITIIGDNDCDGSVEGASNYTQDDATEGKLTYTAKQNSEADSSVPSSDDTATVDWNAAVTGTSAPYTYAISATTSNGGIHVINQTGRELPSTGGMGTTIFYVVGGVLVAGAVILLVTKRRMGTEA